MEVSQHSWAPNSTQSQLDPDTRDTLDAGVPGHCVRINPTRIDPAGGGGPLDGAVGPGASRGRPRWRRAEPGRRSRLGQGAREGGPRGARAVHSGGPCGPRGRASDPHPCTRPVHSGQGRPPVRPRREALGAPQRTWRREELGREAPWRPRHAHSLSTPHRTRGRPAPSPTAGGRVGSAHQQPGNRHLSHWYLLSLNQTTWKAAPGVEPAGDGAGPTLPAHRAGNTYSLEMSSRWRWMPFCRNWTAGSSVPAL